MGPFWGPLKRGHFTPFRWGSEKGSKLRFFDGLGICNDANEVIWLIRSEGLCNGIGKEDPREVKIWPFPGLTLRPKMGLKQGPEGSDRWISWALEIS